MRKNFFFVPEIFFPAAIINGSLQSTEKDNRAFLQASQCLGAPNVTECIYNLSAPEVVLAAPITVYPYWNEMYAFQLPTKEEYDANIAVVDGVFLPVGIPDVRSCLKFFFLLFVGF